ncbi:helix-turn-helix domain-containing protein [Neobacillus sp. MER 74]|uniref:helix-turn-helix domain-containing protein n=1 Tax=Neobacillus sp. MER 74 TaxID=2939566 RepID=UPI00203C6859|nr:helix-turn-helix transcriptional regulator [Neobacillus sp. MER 74]MCM3115091.1 helix-turn-helix domain-containing protein [Neobacillus sp. MER 74]
MIGRNIYEIRMKNGLTLSELAERSGISKSYLSNIERSLNQNPSIQVINKIALVLNVDLKTLLENETSQKEEVILDHDVIALVKEIKESGIKKEQIEEYKTLIEFIKWQNQINGVKN